jgi:hypothetical protein
MFVLMSLKVLYAKVNKEKLPNSSDELRKFNHDQQDQHSAQRRACGASISLQMLGCLLRSTFEAAMIF